MTHYPSLLVLINREHARLFRVEEESIEELPQVDDPKDTYSDRESRFGAGAPDMMQGRDEEHLRHHVRHTITQLKEIWGRDTYHHLTIVVPGKYKGAVEQELKTHASGVTPNFLDGNYPEANQEELRELFLKSLRPK